MHMPQTPSTTRRTPTLNKLCFAFAMWRKIKHLRSHNPLSSPLGASDPSRTARNTGAQARRDCPSSEPEFVFVTRLISSQSQTRNDSHALHPQFDVASMRPDASHNQHPPAMSKTPRINAELALTHATPTANIGDSEPQKADCSSPACLGTKHCE